MKAFFVTGCGTDIGKTFISAALLRCWRSQGIMVDAFKPVLSGVDVRYDDASILLDALGKHTTLNQRTKIAPNQFTAPLSPHKASIQEGVTLSADIIIKQCTHYMAASNADVMLIEGAGGVAVPLNHHELILDVIVGLALDVIFITGDYLGSISHCLTALHMLKQHACHIAHIIVNQSEHSVGLHDMVTIIKDMSPYDVPITPIYRQHNTSLLHQTDITMLAQAIMHKS